MKQYNQLLTSSGENLQGQPWNVYPRPQLKRDSFICLNGEWDFCLTDGFEKPDFSENKKILVPFAPESLLSGINEVFDESSMLWYQKNFTLPEGFVRSKVILHFGACDQVADVFVNGECVGKHEGGYEAFSFDITPYLKDENTILVSVKDTLSDHRFPYGKQRRDRGGMWYTPVSGIWQTVWLESVPESYVRTLYAEFDGETVTVTATGVGEGSICVNTPDGEKTFALKDGKALVTFDNPRFWSPEDPYLYTFTLTSGEDRVESYFAIRTLEIKTVDGLSRLCLNGKPYFFHGLLDQGYWSDGLFLPATPKGYEDDILAMKSLGFNTLRKHIKVEPQQFYYDCDRLGMVVFQDMVNNGEYSFLRDTLLPTVGIFRKNDKTEARNDQEEKTRQLFIEGMKSTVESLKVHPCICMWTIFNEGWGQFESDWMYGILRSLDKTRFIDTTSGWFEIGESDVDSRHVYFRKVSLEASDKPLVLSEFGGYSYKPEDHVFNTKQTYGYGKCKTREAFVKAFCDLYENEIVPLIPKGLCAAVYTQVSDVEDETNGILSYDRKVMKVNPEEFAHVSEKLKI